MEHQLSNDEIESAIYNWLDQSGSHITDKYPNMEPIKIEHCGITLHFEEDVGEI